MGTKICINRLKIKHYSFTITITSITKDFTNEVIVYRVITYPNPLLIV